MGCNRMIKVRNVALGMIVCMFLLTTGCETLELMGGPQNTFQGHDSLVLKTPRPDILDVIAEVGKSNGYTVAAFDAERRTITLSGGSIAGALVGRVSGIGLTFSSNEGGNQLDILVAVTGNYGAGSQDHANAVVKDFKNKLLSRLEQGQ